MKHYDRMFTAKGIGNSFWMDAQSEPEIVSFDGNELTLKISCWLNNTEDPKSEAIDAPYYLKVIFKTAMGYQVLSSELPHYELDYGEYADPPFLFEVNHDKINAGSFINRGDERWYPKVVKREDKTNWFLQMDKWRPTDKKIELPEEIMHFIVTGHDTYIEVLASSFTINKISVD
jgi:hypothetical protein